MNANNVTGYIDYFRQLAVRHKDIKHDPTGETDNGKVGTQRFTRFSADEVLAGLRIGIDFTSAALLIELYETDLSAETVYDVRQRPKGAFSVLRNVKNGDFADEEYAFAFTESIVYDILKQIWQDHYGEDKDACTTPFKSFDFKSLLVPVGPLFNGVYGYRLEFDFEFQKTIDITVPPAAGTFT